MLTFYVILCLIICDVLPLSSDPNLVDYYLPTDLDSTIKVIEKDKSKRALLGTYCKPELENRESEFEMRTQEQKCLEKRKMLSKARAFGALETKGLTYVGKTLNNSGCRRLHHCTSLCMPLSFLSFL